jgi:hypothetical protein
MGDSLDEFYKQYHVNLIVLFGVIIVIYIGIFTIFNNYSFNTPEARPWIMMIEIIMWGLFILIIFMNLKYFSVFEFNLNQMLFNLFGTKHPEIQIEVNKENKSKKEELYYEKEEEDKNKKDKDTKNSEEIPNSTDMAKKCQDEKEKGEVFHIPQNTYTYDEAEKTCKLFDARLASYDEIEEAYKKGANWCSYGWSSDQLALFPIQKTMYNELKKIPGHERDCGRTGVNGGYMEDKETQFGVNCYGKKPYAGEDDKKYMKKYSFSNAYADEDLKEQQRKAEKMNKILIAPFNKEKWNED